ncbi:MAG: hypothetical protein ABFD91_01630 [Anaerohalosphaeraceae bacterium]
MTHQANIAQILYEAYPHADLLPIEPDRDCCDLAALLKQVTTYPIGDDLFRFMVVEIAEGGEGTLDGAIRVMECAKQDVAAVLQALRRAQNSQEPVGTAEDLLEVCKTLVSYTSDLLYQLDNQADLEEIDPIRQAKAVLTRYGPVNTPVQTQCGRMIVKEQSAGYPEATIPIQLVYKDGQLWIQPQGYGEKNAEDGEGFPVGIEIWQGKLRLIVFDDIHSDTPQMIDLEKARESCRDKE